MSPKTCESSATNSLIEFSSDWQNSSSARRSPKKKGDVHLWDLVIDCFECHACSSDAERLRYYHAGAHGGAMRCKRGAICRARAFVKRKDAVQNVCRKLEELLVADEELIAQIVTKALDSSADVASDHAEACDRLERQLKQLAHKIEDLHDLLGAGGDDERADRKARIRAAEAEKASLKSQLSQLQHRCSAQSKAITPDRVLEVIHHLRRLLEDDASGKLGADAIHRAAMAFRLLVGGRITIHVERRVGRNCSNIKGTFRPCLVEAVREQLGDPALSPSSPAPEVTVWLREPPFCDRWAERVHQLIDVDKQSYRQAEKTLRLEGFEGNSGKVWQVYHRYWEMIGQPVPKKPYNNGHLRRKRSA